MDLPPGASRTLTPGGVSALCMHVRSAACVVRFWTPCAHPSRTVKAVRPPSVGRPESSCTQPSKYSEIRMLQHLAPACLHVVSFCLASLCNALDNALAYTLSLLTYRTPKQTR